MKTQINNELIRSFNPCYDPKDVCAENETLSIREWIEKYRNVVKSKEDVIWLICRNDFMTDKDLRLFAVWCARTTYSLYDSLDQIDPRSITAIDTAERYANGEATDDELSAAREAARGASWGASQGSALEASRGVARGAAWEASRGASQGSALEASRGVAREAARGAAWEAAWEAAREAQIDQLLTYFK
jgi:hypothetical protein